MGNREDEKRQNMNPFSVRAIDPDLKLQECSVYGTIDTAIDGPQGHNVKSGCAGSDEPGGFAGSDELGKDMIGKYEQAGGKLGALVDRKQAAYGDSFGRSGAVLRVLYPDGISVDQYDDVLSVVRVIDKLFRIATDRDAMGESPWQDIAGYGLLSSVRDSVD
jgi:hypothetical protein